MLTKGRPATIGETRGLKGIRDMTELRGFIGERESFEGTKLQTVTSNSRLMIEERKSARHAKCVLQLSCRVIA